MKPKYECPDCIASPDGVCHGCDAWQKGIYDISQVEPARPSPEQALEHILEHVEKCHCPSKVLLAIRVLRGAK
jgi:hypothetical protein